MKDRLNAPVPPDIPHDKLLEYSWQLNREITRERRAEESEERPHIPINFNPQLEAEAAALQERLDRRSGRDRAAEARDEQERILIRYLQARDGPTGQAWEPPVSLREKEDRRFRRLCAELRNPYF